MAYGQFVTPKHNAKRCAPGLTLCATFERFSTTQKVDFQLPTTDGASSCCAIRNRIGIRSSHWFSSNSEASRTTAAQGCIRFGHAGKLRQKAQIADLT